MSEPTTDQTTMFTVAAQDVLDGITQAREKEIISRRFGLYERKETLEQIGDMLGITRERVRQIEKAILVRIRLRLADGHLPSVTAAEKTVTTHLVEMGRTARVQDLATHIFGREAQQTERSHVAFIAELSPSITVINENDDYYPATAMATVGDEKSIKKQIETIAKTIKKHGEPITAEALHQQLDYEHPSHIAALASVSKKLAQLKGNWGLAKWPAVNPKNIRDKIFVVLEDSGKPMHFSEIADAIKDSDFKRKNVTTQAIHNELIKDKRFVLIGRGIYALDSWGYSRGTVADIITDVLKKAGEPLHRDEIVRRVLESRQVKETTILLNLQSKPQFKRTAKAIYTFEEPVV
ncbi:MAG: sigma factor-like helix-turn-helix DNA-binding protein [Candidatus Saccharibacteria bacterium]|nr:sigma factor-like helix-turn-helix DNA-binding protein [Candidatus Saccharibacteria bacterium]